MGRLYARPGAAISTSLLSGGPKRDLRGLDRGGLFSAGGGEAPPRPYRVPYGKTGAGTVGTGRGTGTTRVPVCTCTGPCSVVSPSIESCSSL